MPTNVVSTLVKRANSGGWRWCVMDIGTAVQTGWASSKAEAARLAKQAKRAYSDRIATCHARLKSQRPSKCRFLFGKQCLD